MLTDGLIACLHIARQYSNECFWVGDLVLGVKTRLHALHERKTIIASRKNGRNSSTGDRNSKWFVTEVSELYLEPCEA